MISFEADCMLTKPICISHVNLYCIHTILYLELEIEMNMSSQKSRRSDKIKIEFPLITDHVIYSRVIYVIYRVVSIVVEIEHMAVLYPFCNPCCITT